MSGPPRPTTGPVAALMDEFELAARSIMAVAEDLSDEEFEKPRAEAGDLRSIGDVVRHVVEAGFEDAGEFRAAFGMGPVGPPPLATREQCVAGLHAMVATLAATLDGRWAMTWEEGSALRITMPWGIEYTFEQLFEHAIVHVLRHRRQIERFLRLG